jgi:hypothetical protein
MYIYIYIAYQYGCHFAIAVFDPPRLHFNPLGPILSPRNWCGNGTADHL